LIRIPRYTAGKDSAMRAELRCPDPSCNPYIAFSAMLVTALDGIDRELKPSPPPNNINVYELTTDERRERGVTELPGSLKEALDEMEQDEVVRNALAPGLYETFMRAKRSEWDDYRIHVSDWEIDKFLQTA